MSHKVYILLDRSASMDKLWSEALGSINGYVKKLENNVDIMLAAFDSISYEILRDTTARRWEDVTSKDAEPRGSTPLFDSSARMMQRILDDNPEKAVFIVMTDGFENCSQHFKQADVKDLNRKLDLKKYETLFLGANFDAVGDVATKQYNRMEGKFRNMQPQEFDAVLSGSAHATTEYFNDRLGARGIDLTDIIVDFNGKKAS